MPTGRVLRAQNSFFYVQTEEGVVSCTLRGRFRKGEAVYPGDRVEIRILPEGGVVEKLLERRNLLKRPAVANIDRVILVFSYDRPKLHPLLLNRFLVLAEWSRISSIILCVNKMDLAGGEGGADFLAAYEGIGYPVLRLSARENLGLEGLRQALEGRTTVFAGPSGVGKSSLLNRMDESFRLATGDVSEKIKRGRHTTRAAQLLPYGGGYIVDTPGFSAVEFEDMDAAELAGCFIEFASYTGSCRFHPCTHSHEPQCAVKEAVEAGAVSRERYDAYLNILSELGQRKREYR